MLLSARSAQEDQKGLSPGSHRGLCHLVEERQVCRGQRGPHSSEMRGNNSLPVLREKWDTHPVSSFWRNPRGECVLYTERRNTATPVLLRTHTLHTTHTLTTHTYSPHTYTHTHTHNGHTDSSSRGHPVLRSPLHHRNSKNSQASISQIPRFLSKEIKIWRTPQEYISKTLSWEKKKPKTCCIKMFQLQVNTCLKLLNRFNLSQH